MAGSVSRRGNFSERDIKKSITKSNSSLWPFLSRDGSLSVIKQVFSFIVGIALFHFDTIYHILAFREQVKKDMARHYIVKKFTTHKLAASMEKGKSLYGFFKRQEPIIPGNKSSFLKIFAGRQSHTNLVDVSRKKGSAILRLLKGSHKTENDSRSKPFFFYRSVRSYVPNTISVTMVVMSNIFGLLPFR